MAGFSRAGAEEDLSGNSGSYKLNISNIYEGYTYNFPLGRNWICFYGIGLWRLLVVNDVDQSHVNAFFGLRRAEKSHPSMALYNLKKAMFLSPSVAETFEFGIALRSSRGRPQLKMRPMTRMYFEIHSRYY
jgi:hypothetical protein